MGTRIECMESATAVHSCVRLQELAKLEAHEAKLAVAEAQAAKVAEGLERVAGRRRGDTEAAVRRLQAELAHALEIERSRNGDGAAARDAAAAAAAAARSAAGASRRALRELHQARQQSESAQVRRGLPRFHFHGSPVVALEWQTEHADFAARGSVSRFAQAFVEPTASYRFRPQPWVANDWISRTSLQERVPTAPRWSLTTLITVTGSVTWAYVCMHAGRARAVRGAAGAGRGGGAASGGARGKGRAAAGCAGALGRPAGGALRCAGRCG